MAVKKLSARSLVILFLVLAFGVGAIAVIYQGVSNSADIRSRAAQESAVVKSWEFTQVPTTWQSTGVTSFGAANSLLSFRTTSGRASIFQTNGYTLPAGIKEFQISLRVTPVTGGRYYIQGFPSGTTPRPLPTQAPFSYSMNVRLQTATAPVRQEVGRDFGKEVAFSISNAKADGQFYTYSVQIPSTLTAVNVQRTTVEFPEFSSYPGARVDINWIKIVRLNRPRPSITPVPPISSLEGAVERTGTPVDVGVSPYRLRTDSGQVYVLTPLREEPTNPAILNGRPTEPVNLAAAVGKRVVVRGRLNGSVKVGSSMMQVFEVATVAVLGSAGAPPPISGTPVQGGWVKTTPAQRIFAQ